MAMGFAGNNDDSISTEFPAAGISDGPETEKTNRSKMIRIFLRQQPAEKNRNGILISRFVMPAGPSVRF